MVASTLTNVEEWNPAEAGLAPAPSKKGSKEPKPVKEPKKEKEEEEEDDATAAAAAATAKEDKDAADMAGRDRVTRTTPDHCVGITTFSSNDV